MILRSFLRGVSATGLAALGSDADPSTLSGAAAKAYAGGDNVLAVPVASDQPLPLRLAVAASYVGGGSPSLVADVFVWEPSLATWYPVQRSVSLTVGAITYVPIPTAAKGGIYAVVASATSPPTGTYGFGLGLDYGGGGSITATVTGLPATLDAGSLRVALEKDATGTLASIVTATQTTAGAVSGGKVLTTETSAAGAKADLDTLAATVSASKVQVVDASSTTIAGAVSGGRVLTTEASAAGAKTDLDTIAGAVVGSAVEVNAAHWSTYSAGSIVSNGVQVKASPGQVSWFAIANLSGSTLGIALFAATAAQLSGAVYLAVIGPVGNNVSSANAVGSLPGLYVSPAIWVQPTNSVTFSPTGVTSTANITVEYR